MLSLSRFIFFIMMLLIYLVLYYVSRHGSNLSAIHTIVFLLFILRQFFLFLDLHCTDFLQSCLTSKEGKKFYCHIKHQRGEKLIREIKEKRVNQGQLFF